jgi:hypothetical protein
MADSGLYVVSEVVVPLWASSVNLANEGNSTMDGAFNVSIELFPTEGFLEVPGVVGLEQSAAEDALEAAGLTVGPVSTAASSTVQAGDVISQTPPQQA